MDLRIVIVVVLLLIFFNSRQNTTSSKSGKETTNEKKENIKSLIRQTARWSSASIQDENHLIALLHANYGVGYLGALTQIYSQNDIEKYGGINLKNFSAQIYKIQDMATLKMAKNCVFNIPPEFFELAKLAKEI